MDKTNLFNLEERPLSFSSLKNFEESPQHYVAYRNKQFEQTKDMMLGSAFHSLTLEAEKFSSEYFVLDDTEIKAEIGGARPTSTKAYKDWKEMQDADAGDRVVINSDDYDLIQRMRDAIWAHPQAREILEECKAFEKKVEWTNELGLQMTGYLDGFGSDIFVDLKSTRNPNPRAFSRDFFNMNYHVQYAIYDEALDSNFNPVTERKVIAIGKTDPLAVSVMNVTDDVIRLGRDKYADWCQAFCDFRDDPEKFSVAYPGTQDLIVPGWMTGNINVNDIVIQSQP